MGGRYYDLAPAAVLSEFEAVLRKHHGRLLEPMLKTDIRVEVLLAYGPRTKEGFLRGPAVVHRGLEARAKIRITKLEERVAGRGDAVLVLDGDHFADWPSGRLAAVLDHELTHLEPVTRLGDALYDDADRPRLQMRLHDFEVGWFAEVAERHGERSFEVDQATRLANSGQMYFPGFEFRPLVPKKTRRA